MGFTSHDDLINKVSTLGQYFRADWQKAAHPVGAQAAGYWYHLFHSAGSPTNGILNGGTNMSFQSLCEESQGAIRHGGVVAPSTKHLLNAAAFSSAATTMPCVFLLVDMLGYYPISTVTTTGDQALINTATVTFTNATEIMNHASVDIASFTRIRLTTSGTLPAELSVGTDYWTVRQSATTSKLATSYANAVAGTTIAITTDGTPTITATMGLPRYTTGAGVRQVVVANTAMGATTASLRLTYTDSVGNTGNLTPTTLPTLLTAAPVGHVVHSGPAVNKHGPFLPLAVGDTGVQSVEQFNLSSTYTSGTAATILCKPLIWLPMTAIGVASERDFINQLPSLPQVQDGACLAWMMYAGAATPVSSNFIGSLDFGWG